MNLLCKTAIIQTAKYLIIWLCLNVVAGALTGLIIAPFGPYAKLEAQSIFLSLIFTGAGLFYFTGSEFKISPGSIVRMFYGDRRKCFTVALKYLSLYIGALVVIVVLLVGVSTLLSALLEGSEGKTWIFSHAGVSQDFLIFNRIWPSLAGSVFYFLAVSLVAPVVEELFYRRVLFSELRQGFGFLISMGISSLVFGLFHSNILISGITGAYLAYVYEKEKSLPINILLHALLNAFTILLMISLRCLQPYLLGKV